MAVIELTNLTKSYGKNRGIEDVNLKIESGEIFGFIGPNGAGKSTTIRTMLGLLKPTRGKALIFGKDVNLEPSIKASIGYLPSEVFYYDHMRVSDLLKYSASFYGKDCSKRIDELCDILDLDVHRKIEDLSFGNRKKVGIVQGLLHEPQLIILDEPTSGLDPLMQKRFFELIQGEHQKGATVFFSSHILSEVQRLCNRVAFVKDGSLIQVASLAELQKNTFKRVLLEAAVPFDLDDFNQDCFSHADRTTTGVHFIYNGSINDLVTFMQRYSLTNAEISEPDLEEIFMAYYGGEASK